jgi:4-amino-4-deoxy-L-arabinose transferase-like glycosyltransferase
MEMLYMVPRVLMGLLAVLDTFFIYKIGEYRYDKRVAFIASFLFAAMPLTWLTRRILLDSIQLPFILLSILFAVYYNKRNSEQEQKQERKRKNIITIKIIKNNH